MAGEEISPAAVAPPPQCQFFVQRKKRLCRMTVKPGRQYCGEHEPQPKTEAGQSDKRIPCPNDPKHTVYASKLMKHLAICNARQTEQPPYIQHNINAPDAAESCPRRPLSSIPKDEIAAVVDKVNRLYAKHVEGHITDEPSLPIHRAVLREFSAEERAESSRRHLRQVSALLWSVERAGLAQERTCYVELGAGKGQLSYYACHAWCAGASRVLAVDRAPLRHKRDNKLRSAPPTPPAPPATPAGDTASPGSNSTYTSQHTGPTSTAKSNKQSRISEFMDTAGDSDNHNRTGPANGDSSNDTISKQSGIDQHNSSSDTDNGLIDLKKLASLDNEREAISNDINYSNTERELLDDNSSEQKSVDTAKDIDDEKSEVAVRLRADLAHLALEAVPVVAECAAVVGIAKHLCGVATDLALRCVCASRMRPACRGAVIAACCHHRVQRALYVASTQLQELGIDAEDFNVMLGIVSWATCGDGRSRAARAQQPGPSTPDTRGREQPAPAQEPGPSTLDTRGREQPAPAQEPGPSTLDTRGREWPAPAQEPGPSTLDTRGREQPAPAQEPGPSTPDTRGREHPAPAQQPGPSTPDTRGREHPAPAQEPGPSTPDTRGREHPAPAQEPRQGHGLSREQQEAAGRRAKALLDWGRVLWLRERGFDARLAYYVPREVSLENTVIIAAKR